MVVRFVGVVEVFIGRVGESRGILGYRIVGFVIFILVILD